MSKFDPKALAALDLSDLDTTEFDAEADAQDQGDEPEHDETAG